MLDIKEVHAFLLIHESKRYFLHIKINQLQHEKEELRARFVSLENDFERVLRAAKQTDLRFTEFRDMLYTNIQLQKGEAEKELGVGVGLWSRLFGCCL